MNKSRVFWAGLSGWFHIFLFPVLISLIVSLLVYLTMPALIGIALSALLVLIGALTGIIMATRILRRRGAASFVAQPAEEAPATEISEEPKS